jgi:hypothetical protein
MTSLIQELLVNPQVRADTDLTHKAIENQNFLPWNN